MRILLVTAGSHGDINPFIAMARALHGHDVRLLVNPYYEKQVKEAGVAFEPLGELIDLQRIGQDYPDLMHPRKGGRVVLEQLMIPTSREAFKRVQELADTWTPDAVVHHFVVPGAAWAAAKRGIPCGNVVLAPINWLSRYESAVWAPWVPDNTPLWIARGMWHVLRPALAWMLDPTMNRLRAELGLPKQRNIFESAMRGGTLNLGMWSPVFRGPLPDDPEHGVICGFPWHDRHGDIETPSAEIEEFLNEGAPPIMFTLGTAAVHVAGDFYDLAAEACGMLQRRGLLLVGPRESAPRAMPPGVRAFAYAPFSSVMPRCAVNVHHGGVGSTAQAMRAGRPTLVIPHAHDQFDNAARVRRMGISETLSRQRVTAKRLAAKLDLVLSNRDMPARAAAIGKRLQQEDGAAVAAKHIVRLAGSSD